MTQPSAKGQEVDFSETLQWVLRICKRGRWLILFATLVTVIGANLGLRFVPDKYRSDATILVAESQISANFVTPYSATPAMERVQVAARDILSEPLLIDVINQFGLRGANESADSAVENLRKNIEIEPTPPYAAFRVSFTAKTPKLAQQVNKKLVDLFIERHLQLEANQVETASSLIQDQLADRKKALSELDANMRNIRSQYGADYLDEQRLRQAQTRLDVVTDSRDRAKEHRALMESNLIASISSRLGRLQDERTALLKRLTPKNPEVIGKDQQIAQLEAEIAAVNAGTKTLQNGDVLAAVDPSIGPLQAQIEASALEIENLNKEIAKQTALVADSERHLNSNATQKQQVNTMATEAKELNDEIADLTKKQQQSGLAADMQRRQDQQQFRLVDPPSFPTHPASRRRQLASLGALGVGPLLGLLVAFLLDFRNSTFHTEVELRRAFAPPLVVSIPQFPTPKEQRKRSRQTAFELVAGTAMAIVILAAELYAYRTLS